ncbi:MAG: hypothetical protein HY455_01075 [Parcubacteria group bacterium]|nr:hypothetical protein [Parcubacteria group bacterium]
MAKFEKPMGIGGNEGAPEAPRSFSRQEKAKLTREINALERQLERLAHEDNGKPGTKAERERVGAERNRLWDLRNQMDEAPAVAPKDVFSEVPLGEGSFDETDDVSPEAMRVAGETYGSAPVKDTEVPLDPELPKAPPAPPYASSAWTGRFTPEEEAANKKITAFKRRIQAIKEGKVPASSAEDERQFLEELGKMVPTVDPTEEDAVEGGWIHKKRADAEVSPRMSSDRGGVPTVQDAVDAGILEQEQEPRRPRGRRQALVTPKADSEFPQAERAMTPEEQAERMEAWLGAMQASLQAEAERKSLWQYMKGASERYSKLPFYQKIAVGLALTAGVGSGALLGGPAGLAVTAGAMAAKLGVGFLTFLGTYEAVESLAERSRERQIKFWNKYPKVLGAVAGAISGGISAYSIGHALEWVADTFAVNATEGAARVATEVAVGSGADLKAELGALGVETSSASDYAPGSGVYGTEVAASQDGVVEGVAQEAARTAPEITAEAVRTITAEVAKGDTVWGLLKGAISTDLQGLSPEQQTYVIDGIKDKLAAMSPQELKDIGIKSGNIDRIFPGQKIDFTTLLGDSSLVEKLKTGAENLTAEQLQNIREGGAVGAAPAPEVVEAPTVGEVPKTAEGAPETNLNQETEGVERMGAEIFFDKSAANIYEQANGELVAWGGTDDAKAALAERLASETGKQVRVDASMGSYYVTPEGSRVSIEETFKSFGDWWGRLWGNMPEPEGVTTMLTRNK